MKNFIGVKMLKAKPMTRGGYNNYRGWDIPVDENPADEGYLVFHTSGLPQWLPKEEFEAAYFEMDGDGTAITQFMVDTFRGKTKASRLDPKTTLVSAECLTGFVQHEVSSCVDPANYDEIVGHDIGEARINNTLWLCLGFVLQWAKNGLSPKK